MDEFSRTLYLQGDDPKDALLLEHRSGKELSELVSGHELVVIDEAQKIKDIGVTLKLIADNVRETKVIAIGSSSFELANKLNEPLTGRNRKFHLYPLSISEPVFIRRHTQFLRFRKSGQTARPARRKRDILHGTG